MARSESSSKSRPVRTALSDGVYDILLSRLLDGTTKAGQALNIDALARELSVSQTPIREALARLEATGLVTRAALRGYRVAPLFTPRELDDLAQARLVIEPVNAFLAASRTNASLLRDLERSIRELESSRRGTDFESFAGYWQADERFHTLIAEHADNRFLLNAYQALGGHVQRFRLFGGFGVTDADAAIAEHLQIFDAVSSGDAASARTAMARHISAVKTRTEADLEHQI